MDPGAGVVVAVGLWRGAGHRGREDGVVLRVAGVVAVSGGGAAAGQDVAVGGDRAGSDAASLRWRPTYALTDNEKTVTVEHVCGIAVRNPQIVEVSRHYGLTVATCEPADPQAKALVS